MPAQRAQVAQASLDGSLHGRGRGQAGEGVAHFRQQAPHLGQPDGLNALPTFSKGEGLAQRLTDSGVGVGLSAGGIVAVSTVEREAIANSCIRRYLPTPGSPEMRMSPPECRRRCASVNVRQAASRPVKGKPRLGKTVQVGVTGAAAGRAASAASYAARVSGSGLTPSSRSRIRVQCSNWRAAAVRSLLVE